MSWFPFNIFQSKTVISNSSEEQRLQQQRSLQGQRMPIVVGRKYIRPEISLNYNIPYEYFNTCNSLNNAVNRIAVDATQIDLTEIDKEKSDVDRFDKAFLRFQNEKIRCIKYNHSLDAIVQD